MAQWMSDAKAGEILAEVQLNPEIGGDDSAFVVSIIQRAARFIMSQTTRGRYPELSQGYSESGASASENVSAETNKELLISIDDDQFYTIDLTGDLDTGAKIATELQVQIRAIAIASYSNATVAFSDGKYTITSPTFGEASHVTIWFNTDREDIAIALKLSTTYGGTEWAGGLAGPEYDDIVVALVQHWYNRVGVEGMKSFSIPGSGSYTEHDMDPAVHMFIMDHRRLLL